MAVLAVQTSLGYMTVAALLLLQAPPFFFSAFSHWENKKENAPILGCSNSAVVVAQKCKVRRASHCPQTDPAVFQDADGVNC